MNTGETQGYILTFCCVNCGKPEIFAQYPSEDVVPEDQIRARIYQVGCNYCGWRGDSSRGKHELQKCRVLKARYRHGEIEVVKELERLAGMASDLAQAPSSKGFL